MKPLNPLEPNLAGMFMRRYFNFKFEIKIFGADRKFNMAVGANNVLFTATSTCQTIQHHNIL